MRTIIGIFDDDKEAELAILDLEKAGASPSDISVISTEPLTTDLADIHLNQLEVEGHGLVGACGPLSTYLTQSSALGAPDAMVAALERMGLSSSYAQSYVDAIGRGLTFEAVLVQDDKADEALAIMRAHAQPLTEPTSGRLAGEAAANAILPVVTEELKVGKRQIETGGVRVSSKVTETPVEADIKLRKERIDLESRPADRPVSPADAAFEERTIDVVATSEEPVIEKRARVVEEIIVRKDVDTSTETVHDTLRRTDVSLEPLGAFDLSRYESHFKTTYAKDQTYGLEAYAHAYRFGLELRSDARFASGQWAEIEPNARNAWEEKNPGTWDRFKAAVQHAWERANPSKK
jgi:uncharacterized protein (TIGR02271 family)